MSAVRLSAVLITRNEAPRIEASLAALRFCDEVVVVDSESTDGTPALAAAAGARVVTRPWPGDFADQRNYADAQATGEWCFSVDPDEEVSDALAVEIRRFVADPGQYVAMTFARRELIFGRWIDGGGWATQRKLRLYRRGAGRWTGRVHEKMVIDGPVAHAVEPLVHRSYDRVETFVDKFNRYSSMDARLDFETGRRFSWWALATQPVERAFGRFVLHGGYRDGAHGLVLALLVGLNYLLRHLKLWELEYRATHPAPAERQRGGEGGSLPRSGGEFTTMRDGGGGVSTTEARP